MFTLGYPLITLIGNIVWRVFYWLSTPAFLLNFLSAFFASVSVFFLTATTFYLTNGDEAASVFSSCMGCFGFFNSVNLVWKNSMDSL